LDGFGFAGTKIRPALVRPPDQKVLKCCSIFQKRAKNMLGIFCRQQKRGLFSSVFTFLKEHSRGYVTEKRGKMAGKEPFLIR